jgi:hypothetical protein
MTIRIGNVVYIEGMVPIEVEPMDSLTLIADAEPAKNALDDLLAVRPGGIVRFRALKPMLPMTIDRDGKLSY